VNVNDVCPIHCGDRIVVRTEPHRFACMHREYASIAVWHSAWDLFVLVWRTIGVTYATEESDLRDRGWA